MSQRTGRPCPVAGCASTPRCGQLMCPADWQRVPEPIRKAVWAAWRDGDGLGTPGHQAAAAAAIRAAENARRQP